MKRLAKIIIGIILLPVSGAFFIVFGRLLLTLPWHTQPYTVFFWGGMFYLIAFLLLRVGAFSYVLGHELSHALVSILCGGTLRAISVSQTSGNVRVTKTNIIVALAPYLIPFYSLAVVIIYFCISLLANARPFAMSTVFLLGATLMHHIIYTINAVKTRQSDFYPYGRLLSYNIIVIGNMALSVFLLSLFFPAVSWAEFYKKSLSFLHYLLRLLI